MTEQCIEIPRYNWTAEILHDVYPEDTDYIIDRLRYMGCPQKHLRKAKIMLNSGLPNQGLTYSDKQVGHTLIVVCHADNMGQYINTLVHEVDHMADHISQCYGIPYDSEENSYLLGDVVEAIHNDAMKYVIHRYLGTLN